jgi:hypothetical protein
VKLQIASVFYTTCHGLLGSLPAQPQNMDIADPKLPEPNQYLKNITEKPNKPKRTTTGSIQQLHLTDTQHYKNTSTNSTTDPGTSRNRHQFT